MRKERGPQHVTIEARISAMVDAGASKDAICDELNITREDLNSRLSRIRSKRREMEGQK